MHAYVHTYIRTLHYITITVTITITITLTLHYTTLHSIPLHTLHIYIHIYSILWSSILESHQILSNPLVFLIFVCIYFKFDRVYVYIVFQHQISWRSPRTSVPGGSIAVPSENRTTKGAGFYPPLIDHLLIKNCSSIEQPPPIWPIWVSYNISLT